MRSTPLEGGLDEAQAVVMRLDEDGRVLAVNPPARAALGLEDEALVGQSWFELVPAPLAARAREMLLGWFGGAYGPFAIFQCPLVGSDGAPRGMTWSLMPAGSGAILCGAPLPPGAEQSRWRPPVPPHAALEAPSVEERAAGDARLLDSIVENIPDMLFVKDASDLRFVRFNRAGEAMLGKSREEMVGRNDHELFEREDADFFTQKDREVLARGVPVDIPEEPIHTAEGLRWLRTKKIPLLDEDGNAEYLLGISEDITERKRAAEALQKLTDELARSNQELEQFAYAASHDLQEPLRMVRSFANLMARRYRGRLDAEADEFLGYISDGAARMQNLISGLLSWSRVDSEGQPFAPTDCNAVLRTVLFDLQLAIREAEARITIDPLPVIRGDAPQLGQLFTNLVGNAVKFRGEVLPEVRVSAREEGGHWLFSVRDNGIGIDPASRDRLFRPFQRLRTRSAYPGTGLGLSICKRIVERHGGRIWVESAPGGGSEFRFLLPRLESVSEPAEVAQIAV